MWASNAAVNMHVKFCGVYSPRVSRRKLDKKRVRNLRSLRSVQFREQHPPEEKTLTVYIIAVPRSAGEGEACKQHVFTDCDIVSSGITCRNEHSRYLYNT